LLGNRPSIAVFFTLTAIVFVSLYPYLPRVRNPNENTRTYTTMAVVEDHTFCVDLPVQHYGATGDLARVPKPDGTSHLYSVKAPGNTYLAIPVYWAFRKLAPLLHLSAKPPIPTSKPDERERWFEATTFVLRFFTVQIPCFLFLVWFERWLRRLVADVVLRLAAVVGVGLGTNYLAYSLMFVSHTLCAICAFLAFALTAESWLKKPNARLRSAWTAFLIGLATGGTVIFEYHALPAALILGIFALCVHYRPKQILGLVLGGGIHVAGMMYYQWRSYGNPLTPGHKFVENPMFRAQHEKGLYGIQLPHLDVISQLAFSRAFGFFGTSPFMWLGLVGIPFGIFFVARHRPERKKLRVLFGLMWFLILCAFLPVSGFLNWHGGWSVGPRYWSIGPPFFAFAAAFGLDNIASRWPRMRPVVRALAVGLALASVLQTGLISILYNTLPEQITRPLPEAALPLLRDGFFPHHLGELVGWQSARFFYVVLACFLLAALVPFLTRVRESWLAWTVRGVLALGFAGVGLWPAFTPPAFEEGDDHGASTRFLVDAWDPPGRDGIKRQRERVLADATKGPCPRLDLARMEKLVGMAGEAKRDEAGQDASKCRGLLPRFDGLLEKYAHQPPLPPKPPKPAAAK